MSDNAETVTIKISNPNNLPVSDYRTWIPLQGDLKDLSEVNYNKLKNVLIKRGFKVPAFLWKNPTDNLLYIMDAHQRQRVMVKENMQPYEVPYILIEAATEAEAKAQLLEISSQYGTITQEGFDTFTANLPEADLADLYFDRLTDFSRETESEVEEDEAPEISSEPPVSKLGEIYQLGRHRVMCGDSLKDIDTLMGETIADMIFTDPPYNVDYGSSKNPRHKIRSIENDSMNDSDWAEFNEHLAQTMSARCSGDVYIFGAPGPDGMRARLAYVDAGFHWSATIIWKKQQLVLSPAKYQRIYEPCFYGWHNNGMSSFVGDRKQVELWEINRPLNSKEHPTMKPIELCAKGILNSSKKNDIVLDLFLGSGSTLIACEQTDRICYGMELDPKYTDVIRKRYWKFVSGSEEGWQEATKAINAEAMVSDGERTESKTV